MGFATGSITFRRYYICGDHPSTLNDAWFESIAAHAFGRHGEASPDAIETGWIVPSHLFDVDFSAPHRISVGRFVYLAMRVDRTAAPGAILKSYRKMEEETALAANAGEGLSRADRNLARQTADDRAAHEAREGRFRRIAAYPVLIDLQEGVVYFGNLGTAAADKLITLFSDTFQTTIAPATVEEVAYRIAQQAGTERAFEDAAPTHFADPPSAADEAASLEFPDYKSFLGREFLTWLWYRSDTAEGLFEIDDKPVTLAIHRMMMLECGYERTGKVTIHTDGPGSAPEARSALRLGKQPTKVALLVAHGGDEWSLSLDGARWNVSGLALPASEAADAFERLEERFHSIRECGRTLDRLLACFLQSRLTADWASESAAIRRWANPTGEAHQAPLRRASA